MSENQTVKFGDICREVKLTTKDPIADGYERYIGLEHLDSGSLKIKRWGLLEGGNSSFTRVFKKGNILIGKRRPYLKKAAVADFDGVCSSDLIVVKEKSNLLKGTLLPYIIQSQEFWNWAVKTSAGGLSPRTKFKELEKFLFVLPSDQEKDRFEKILFNNSSVLEKADQALLKLQKLKRVMLETHLDIGKWASLLKVVNRNSYNWVKLDSITKRGTGHTPSKQHSNYWDGGIKWVSLQDSKKLDKIYIKNTSQEISIEGIKNSSATLHPKGTVTVCRDASIGMSAILEEEMAVSQHFITWTCSESIYPLFLYYWLQRLKPVMEAVAIGSTIKTIGMGFFEKLEIPLPEFNVQVRIADSLRELDITLCEIEKSIAFKKSIQISISSEIIRG